MNEKFLIAKYIKDFIDSLDDIIMNFPKREYELRNRIVNCSYELLELIFLVNNIDDKMAYKGQILSKISMIDYCLEKSYRKKIISERICLNRNNKLISITKMIHKWINDEDIVPTTT